MIADKKTVTINDVRVLRRIKERGYKSCFSLDIK